MVRVRYLNSNLPGDTWCVLVCTVTKVAPLLTTPSRSVCHFRFLAYAWNQSYQTHEADWPLCALLAGCRTKRNVASSSHRLGCCCRYCSSRSSSAQWRPCELHMVSHYDDFYATFSMNRIFLSPRKKIREAVWWMLHVWSTATCIPCQFK